MRDTKRINQRITVLKTRIARICKARHITKDELLILLPTIHGELVELRMVCSNTLKFDSPE